MFMIITWDELGQLRKKYKNKTIAYSGGCFDLLNEGHIDLFKRLSGMGEIVVIGVTPDERVRLRKGSGRPGHLEKTRLMIVDSIKYVDYTFISPTNAPGYKIIGHRTLKDLRPNYFLTCDPIWLEDQTWLAEQATQIKLIPRLRHDVSTTHTINRILKLNRK